MSRWDQTDRHLLRHRMWGYIEEALAKVLEAHARSKALEAQAHTQRTVLTEADLGDEISGERLLPPIFAGWLPPGRGKLPSQVAPSKVGKNKARQCTMTRKPTKKTFADEKKPSSRRSLTHKDAGK